MSAAMELHVALSLRLDAHEAYRLAFAYEAEALRKQAATLRRVEREETPADASGVREGLLRAALILDGHADQLGTVVGKATVTPAATATPELLPETDTTDPLIVDRFDTAMEPAPEDPPVLIVGAVAADGRPVALFFDTEARDKVAAWLAPKPTRDSARERRLEQLLDTIRTHGGRWTTSRVQDMRRRRGQTAQRGTARHDLAELHGRGHLVEHGPVDGRYYTLATREDRRA
ncbi:hypothetical protein [Streptomyces sp. Je 1-369]|uniref:hypothetical protein n=1 Tax=Streptomyces sp. Je 1-369 TaxID=2966192 RepID=UPI002286A5C7|nr:hypothetical protein [Streptomyces sp. Je 1-369]WAL93928.1 hypothetical protein NOO62_05115 [Streptomyces sp. Je 1-369]